MKISKKEKILLLILICILVVGGYYKLAYTKESNKVDTLRTEKKDNKAKLEKIKLQVVTANKREKDMKVINSKLREKAASLYPVIEQERLIIELDDLLKKSNVEGSFTFSGATNAADGNNKTATSSQATGSNNASDATKKIPTSNGTESTAQKALPSLQPIIDQYNTLSGSKPATSSDKRNNKGSLQYMQAAITFKGSYNNVMNFIKNVENQPKKIVITNLSLSGTNQAITGTATLEFYSVPKLAGMDDDYFKWDYNNKYGKDNPFASETASTKSVIVQDSKIKEQVSDYGMLVKSLNDRLAEISKATIAEDSRTKEARDFEMLVSSVNLEYPAVILDTDKDKYGTACIYADNNSIEPVEISLVEVKGKYYYKYKFEETSYPEDYSGDGIEFTPVSEDIIISIISSKRTSDTDNVGVNIKVINKTSKAVNVNVINDDSKKPRVSVKGEGGQVNTKNK